jgi:hypothetical protein
MLSIQEILKRRPWLGWVIFAATAGIVFLLGMLASSIMERRAEAVFAYTPNITYSEFEPRNSEWGKVFPREYNSYMNTSDTTFKSKYNGSSSIDQVWFSSGPVMPSQKTTSRVGVMRMQLKISGIYSAPGHPGKMFPAPSQIPAGRAKVRMYPG